LVIELDKNIIHHEDTKKKSLIFNALKDSYSRQLLFASFKAFTVGALYRCFRHYSTFRHSRLHTYSIIDRDGVNAEFTGAVVVVVVSGYSWHLTRPTKVLLSNNIEIFPCWE